MLSGARRVSRYLYNPFHIAPTPPAKYTAKIRFTMKRMWNLISFIIRTSVSSVYKMLEMSRISNGGVWAKLTGRI